MRPIYLFSCAVVTTAIACSTTTCPPDEIRVGTVCREIEKPTTDAASTNAAEVDASDSATSKRDATVAVEVIDSAVTEQADDDADVDPVRDSATEVLADAEERTPVDAHVPLEAKSDASTGAATNSPPPSTCLTAEICSDGVDNDCNGKVDDGRPEQCNGIDDDCNPSTLDGAGACGSFACRDGRCLSSCSVESDCASGLKCLVGACQGANDGAACSSDDKCTSGAWHPDGKCGPKLALSAGCDSPGDCVAGATCAPNKTCRLDYGSKCTDDLECASATCYLTCLASKSPLYGPCDGNIDCDISFRCAPGNVCKRWEDQICGSDMECASSMCIAGRCRDKVGTVKAACDTTADCVSGLLCVAMKCKQTANGLCMYSDECVDGLSCVGSVCK